MGGRVDRRDLPARPDDRRCRLVPDAGRGRLRLRGAAAQDGGAMNDLISLMPFAAGVGIVIDKASPDTVTGHLDWAPHLCTAGGAMHGVALMTLAASICVGFAFEGLSGLRWCRSEEHTSELHSLLCLSFAV